MRFCFLRSVITLAFAAPLAVFAADPASGTLSDISGPLTFASGPFTTSNPTPLPEADEGPRCDAINPCDSYQLTVALPAGYAGAHPQDKIRVTTSWDVTSADVDLWVYLGVQGDTDGTDGGFKKSASSSHPETLTLDLTADTSKVYTIKIVPYAASGVTASTRIELVSPPPPPLDADGDGVADPDDECPGTPAGTTVDIAGCPVQDVPEIPLHFHGNTHDSGDGVPCSGYGNNDFITCFGPFLKESAELDPDAPAAHFDYNPIGSSAAQGPYDANWTWQPTAPVTVRGYTKLQWWASCNGTCTALDLGDWDVSVWKNDELVEGAEFVVHSTPSTPDVPALLSGAIRLPAPISLDGKDDILTLKLEHAYSDAGEGSRTYYDSVSACPGATGSLPCDSIVIFNAVAPPPPPPPPPPVPATGLEPRYQIHVAPPSLGNDAGEPSVGYNKFTQRTMFISYTQALRETYQENVDPPLLPASCDATWEDKSGTLTTVNSLDPILFSDEATGRTFNSQLAGDNSLMEYTDDDGENWTPAQAGPPNGGADHQAVATGIYPEDHVPPNASWPETGAKRAVYYCSQSVAGAFCSRSDDGGLTFGPGFLFKNTDCAAGALHGHVKVAPDGTVYVPDSSQCIGALGESATHVVAFMSEDAGQTWDVRDIPFSTGGDGSDPSIGIATDGTMYMCYVDEDSTVHVAVSDDKGVTWSGGQDIGAPAGLTQTRFPQMIAGDPDRASCAFLGTTGARPESPSNDGASLDFEGVWHGFQATTYDGGQSWHLVNVTPNDPVQGWGGIGPSGTNRNLLDFNDLQIDDQGRTLFAFADGCVGGCVKDPSANSFAAKATIVRQTGGRTLFAAFDNRPLTRYNNPTPIAPAAACARQDISQRTVMQTDVVWNAPDTGGSPITEYRVYRALDAAGPFALLGSAGAKTRYVDTTASPSVEKYYYRVEAENAVGVAPVSNTIELEISTQVVVDTCTLPGEIIAQDAEGDGAGDDTDIRYLGVAEPAAFADSFVITEKVADFTADQPPPNSFYPILFPTKGNLYIALDATQGVPKFTHGTYKDVGQGVLAFSEDGALDSRSAFAADGTITMVVPRSLFGDPAAGGIISGFDARARLGGQSATSRDTAGPADYTVRGTGICAAPGVVLGALSASTDRGSAPLDVSFTISGTPPEGQSLDSYSILFGDEEGATPYTGDFSGQGSVQLIHTYVSGGTFRARATVTDTAGTTSTNLAEQTITVLGGTVPGTQPSTQAIGNNKVGGVFSALSLLILGALGAFSLWHRRRPAAS